MEQNHNMLRGISENGGIVFYGVDSTEIVREMERLHKTSAVTTAALGRLLTAASMMGIMLKNTRDSVTLQIKGGGPLGTLLAVQLPIVSVAFGSGGSLPERSTTFARMVLWLNEPLLVLTWMVISCGSDGVCHFTHAI